MGAVKKWLKSFKFFRNEVDEAAIIIDLSLLSGTQKSGYFKP
jgi:hypothetical protein